MSRRRPGSPWMPTPTSISSSPISKIGVPLAGGVQQVSATPIVRTLLLTLSASLSKLVEARAFLGGRAAGLDHEEVAGHAAAADRVRAVLHRDVVVDDERLHLDAFGLGHLDGHVPAHPVALVVVDQHEDALRREFRSLMQLEAVVDRRRGEHAPWQAASSMPGPTAITCAGSWPLPEPWITGHAILLRPVGAVDDVVLRLVLELAGIGERNALEHLRHEFRGIVDELLHCDSPRVGAVDQVGLGSARLHAEFGAEVVAASSRSRRCPDRACSRCGRP